VISRKSGVLSTDKVFAEIQEQLKASATENHTDILKLDAELLEVREIGSELEAVVLFDAIMREDINAQTEQIREVWHFVKLKSASSPNGYWMAFNSWKIKSHNLTARNLRSCFKSCYATRLLRCGVLESSCTSSTLRFLRSLRLALDAFKTRS